MKDKWVSKEYEQEQYLKLTHLSQDDGMSVEDYLKEFEKLCLICDLQEKEAFKIARFVKGLSKTISRKVEVTHYTSFSDVCKLALKFENQAKEEKEKERPRVPYKNTSKYTPSYSKESTFQSKATPSGPKYEAKKEKAVVTPSEFATRRKCFKCHGRGHIASECPSKAVLTATQCAIMDEEEQRYNFVVEEVVDSEDEFDEEIQPEDEFNMMVVRKVLFSEPQSDLRQRNNLFHTRCKIGDKTCNVIVDSGAQTDVISSEAVNKLKLTTRDHEEPYKLNWLNDSTGIKVKKQALVSYSIGGFEDERWCDVLPMDACHLLLGRPWQFDHNSEHKGKSNEYLVTTRDGRKVKLIPLPPKVAKKGKKKATIL